MGKRFKKEDFSRVPGDGTGFLNAKVMAEAMGMDLKKMFVFPDGARISYFNINEKNVKLIIQKFSDYIVPDENIINEDLTYNHGRKGIFYRDGDVTMVVGLVDSLDADCAYKIYKKGDDKIFATFFFQRQEEIIVNKYKKIVRIYDECHRLVRYMEKLDNQLRIFKIDPETNGIACDVYDNNVEN